MRNAIRCMLCMSFVFFNFFSSQLHGKVYDCFIFFNELELLEVRLNELNNVVDKFVLVEMSETFQGAPKPLIFKENQHKFEKFLDKIIYIGVTERISTPDPFVREGYQRDQILRGLQHCSDNDVILISDVDEIVRSDAIARIINALSRVNIVVCEQRMFKFFLNMEERLWLGTFATHYRNLKGNSIDRLRKVYIHNLPPLPIPRFIINNAGWHFSFLGNLDRFIKKIESYSHTPQNTPELANTPDLKSQACIDRYLRDHCHFIEIDQTYPQFILDNIDAFRTNGFIAGSPNRT